MAITFLIFYSRERKL